MTQKFRAEVIMNMHDNVDKELLNKVINFRKILCLANANEIIVMKKFQILQKDITAVTGTQSQMTVTLLEDIISLLLSFIAAACEASIDLHLQRQRQFLKLAHT